MSCGWGEAGNGGHLYCRCPEAYASKVRPPEEQLESERDSGVEEKGENEVEMVDDTPQKRGKEKEGSVVAVTEAAEEETGEEKGKGVAAVAKTWKWGKGRKKKLNK